MKKYTEKINKPFFYILIGTCLLLSCKYDDRKQKLTGSGIKYWDEYEVKQGIKNRIGTYSFSNDNKCKYYVYSKSDRKMKLFNSDDVIYKDSSWSFQDKDIVVIEGFERRILKLTNDALLMQNPKNGDSILLINSDRKLATKNEIIEMLSFVGP
jgi:WD40 repeat protein